MSTPRSRSIRRRAFASGRIVFTRNSQDFIELARAWADEQRPHAGILIAWRKQSAAPKELVDAVHRALLARPEQAWVNLALAA